MKISNMGSWIHFLRTQSLAAVHFKPERVPDTDTGPLWKAESLSRVCSHPPAQKEARVCWILMKNVLQGKRPLFAKPVQPARFVWTCFQVTSLLDKKKPVSNMF